MKTDPAQWAQLFAAVGTLITVIGALLKSFSDSKEARIARAAQSAKIDNNTALTQSTHEATNGRMAELLAVVKASSFAAGQKDQVDKQAVIDAAPSATQPVDSTTPMPNNIWRK